MGVLSSNKFKIIIAVVVVLILFQAFRFYSFEKGGNAEKSVSDDPVPVSVFYEALCPDSKHFFVHHLQNAHDRLKENLSIHLVPYGKAKTFVSPEGDLDFECQHGELECFANKIHSCVVDKIKDPTDQIAMTTCMIKDNMNPEAALKRCVQSYDPDPIMECAKSSTGAELLKNHGIATAAVKPSFIPTVYVRDSKGDQAALLKNFLLEICTYFPEDKKPAPCL